MVSPTVATYDKYHQVYDDETVEFWEKFPREVIKEFVTQLPGKRVLDIGSGPGRDALLLKGEGLEVICLDASLEMVKRTKKLGFRSVLADFRTISFPKNSFDGIWAYTSLLHVGKKEAKEVIKRIKVLLKPNGIFLIGMIEGEFDGNIEGESMPGAKRHFSFYSEDELREVVESCGFELKYQEKYVPHSKTYLNQIYSVVS